MFRSHEHFVEPILLINPIKALINTCYFIFNCTFFSHIIIVDGDVTLKLCRFMMDERRGVENLKKTCWRHLLAGTTILR